MEYNFTKFDNYTLAYRDFEYETNKTMAPLRKIAENKKIEENDLKIDNFINYLHGRRVYGEGSSFWLNKARQRFPSKVACSIVLKQE